MYGISCEWDPKSSARSAWDYLTTAYGTHLYERPNPGGGCRNDEYWVTGVPDIPSLTQYGTPIIISPFLGHDVQGTINLYDFVHPADAIYVFGPDYRNLTWEDISIYPKPPVVYIEVPPGNESREMHAYITAGIVLYDRAVKNRGGAS